LDWKKHRGSADYDFGCRAAKNTNQMHERFPGGFAPWGNSKGCILTHHLANIMGAIRRVKDGLPPEDYDRDLIVPLLETRLAEYAGGEIQFMRCSAGFIIDATTFRRYQGLLYLRELLVKTDKDIPCTTLCPVHTNTESVKLVDSSYYYEVKRSIAALKKGFNDPDWVKQLDFDEAAERGEELAFLEARMSEWTYASKPKSFNNDISRNRSAVCKAIRYALNKVIEHPDTRYVGEHIKENLSLGFSCKYSGKLKWKT